MTLAQALQVAKPADARRLRTRQSQIDAFQKRIAAMRLTLARLEGKR